MIGFLLTNAFGSARGHVLSTLGAIVTWRRRSLSKIHARRGRSPKSLDRSRLLSVQSLGGFYAALSRR